MRRAIFIAAESLWAGGHPPGHPLRPERLRDTWAMLHAYHAFDAPNTSVVPPRFPTDDELLTFHTEPYLNAVRRLSRGDLTVNAIKFGFGPGDNPVFEGMFESEGLKVGAALVAAEQLIAGQVEAAFSFAGGLHHAGPNFASGFCVFGDGVIAIKRLLAHGWRVAYVDIDAHHGDGVQNAFYDDDRVLTISFHESGRFLFPGTGFTHELGQGKGFGYSVNVPLAPLTDDQSFLWAFEAIVPPLLERFKPDVVVSQFGVDAHWRDPLTHLSLTTHGFEALFRRIVQLSPRLLAVGGGGYDSTVVPRAWTLAWAALSEQTFANQLPPKVAGQYNRPTLHDADEPLFETGQQIQSQAIVEAVVADLKDKLKL